MRSSVLALITAAIVTSAALPIVAQAQDNRRGDMSRDRDRDDVRTDRDRGDRGDRGRDVADMATAAELRAADQRLNIVYQRRINEARADDRNDRRVRGWYSQEQALRESERIWITFRDAECRYRTQQAVGQRDHAALTRGCLVDQTNDRIAELRQAETMLSSR